MLAWGPRVRYGKISIKICYDGCVIDVAALVCLFFMSVCTCACTLSALSFFFFVSVFSVCIR